ncbi:PAAR domain-containing protein [Burkholderia anthina]|uniref:PAAR domain-containing protein n=1 Tax=Burkholderia anthina TaxID=179879 RepID=UPI001CF22F2D|nr:PAAR domain-containing protein [Burkholderia anthina]MCA8093117.1 PAAR domain-containing protein [Burkholderia anthina]
MKNELQVPTHLFATVGALTERGGRVTTATSGLTLAGLEVACVGDVVTYDDGSEAAIIDGAENNPSGGKPFALVGSRLSSGDRITETLRSSWGIHVEDGQRVAGLFDPTYVPPLAPPAYRLAVRDATTARGGVLREPSGTWEVAPHVGKAAVVGDLIHYPDGSTARVTSGLGLADGPDFAPLAFVGSGPDNGDTITDSPERQGVASSVVFSVVTRSSMPH